MILPPFAGELNGFTLLFEAFIIKFCSVILMGLPTQDLKEPFL
jgi:hypothetical protein